MSSVSSPKIKTLVHVRHTSKSMLMRLLVQDLLSEDVNVSLIYYLKSDDELRRTDRTCTA